MQLSLSINLVQPVGKHGVSQHNAVVLPGLQAAAENMEAEEPSGWANLLGDPLALLLTLYATALNEDSGWPTGHPRPPPDATDAFKVPSLVSSAAPRPPIPCPMSFCLLGPLSCCLLPAPSPASDV